MNRYHRRNNVSRTIKDYFVPIVGLILIIALIYSFFSSDEPTIQTQQENTTGYALEYQDTNTEAFIEYSGGNKEATSNGTQIFKWEKLIVKEGSVKLRPGENTQIHLDKIWELKLLEDGSFALFSSNMWISSKDPVQIDMRYASVRSTGTSLLTLSQNEVGSTIYVLSGTAEVSNLANQSTLLWKGQKITIQRTEASNEEIDLSLAKWDLDTYFLKSDWFLENNGPVLLAQAETLETSETGSGETSTGTTTPISSTKLLSFSGVEDEWSVTTNTTDITGSYQDENITRITIAWVEATLDTEAKTFTASGVTTDQKVNDLIVKTYAPNNSILWKQVLTVYANGATPAANEPLFKVENFSLDATEFQFISPKQNPYTTSDGVVFIEWRVPAGSVQKILVNGYQLQKFPQYGTYWGYFANEEFGNLKPGLNVYKVEYIGKDGNALHSNAFTIVKNDPAAEQTVSDEADAS